MWDGLWCRDGSVGGCELGRVRTCGLAQAVASVGARLGGGCDVVAMIGLGALGVGLIVGVWGMLRVVVGWRDWSWQRRR